MKTLLHRNAIANKESSTIRAIANFSMILLNVLVMFFGFTTAVHAEVVFIEDFNTDTAGQWPDGWYVDNGVWEHGVPTVGPANCAGGDDNVINDFCVGTVLDGTFPPGTNSRLISPTISLLNVSDDEEIHLRFWQWFSYAYYGNGRVQISVLTDPVNHTWSEWTDLSTTVSMDSDVWSRMAVDLTAYAGQTVRLGFLHSTNASYIASGWYIDALEVEHKVPTFTGDFEDGWDDWWAHTGGDKIRVIRCHICG